MTDAWMMIAATAGILFWAGVVVLLLKLASLLSHMSGRNMRASETERQTWLDMIQRAVERRDHPTGDTLRMHASERMEQARLRAGVERADIDTHGTNTRLDGEIVYGETNDAVHE